MTDVATLETAGWTRRGPFWSPPDSTAKYTRRGAVAHLATATTTGDRPDQSWRKSAIVDWLTQAGATFDPGATKADLLDTAAAIR